MTVRSTARHPAPASARSPGRRPPWAPERLVALRARPAAHELGLSSTSWVPGPRKEGIKDGTAMDLERPASDAAHRPPRVLGTRLVPHPDCERCANIKAPSTSPHSTDRPACSTQDAVGQASRVEARRLPGTRPTQAVPWEGDHPTSGGHCDLAVRLASRAVLARPDPRVTSVGDATATGAIQDRALTASGRQRVDPGPMPRLVQVRGRTVPAASSSRGRIRINSVPSASAADHHLGEDPHHRKIHLMPQECFVFGNSGAATLERQSSTGGAGWRRWCSRPHAEPRPLDLPPGSFATLPTADSCSSDYQRQRRAPCHHWPWRRTGRISAVGSAGS